LTATKKENAMCPHCANGRDRELAYRDHVLQLLTLVEHPTALPPDAALRIGRELLARMGRGAADFRCDDATDSRIPIETAA
jgi:hypothetical protein